MELPGTGYLYNLTLISVTFAGFSALITAFRQMVGGRFTKYDAFLIRSALVSSLIVIVCALLPPLLALFELSAAIIWRLSSLSAGILIALFTLLTQLIIRPMATGKPISKTAHAYHGVQLLTAMFLLMRKVARPGSKNIPSGLVLLRSVKPSRDRQTCFEVPRVSG